MNIYIYIQNKYHFVNVEKNEKNDIAIYIYLIYNNYSNKDYLFLLLNITIKKTA